jgi:hypothetical protein
VTICALGVGPASVSWAGDVNQHAAITITSNAEFTTPTVPSGCRCVVSGNGTAKSPFVIGPWAITNENSSNAAVTVKNVTADFTLTGISANYTDSEPSHPVIELSNVHPVNSALVSSLSANNDGIGVEIDSSSNITLSSVSVNKMKGAGLVIEKSTNIKSINGKYKATSDEVPFHNADGLYAVESSDLRIGGVPGCPNNGICNTFDYDSGWGVYLQETSNVVIENATANADDTGGYILDGSSDVTLKNSTAEAGGPICISLEGAKKPSGYFNTGLLGNLMLINGASDNVIENDTFNGFAPASGYDIAGTPNPFYFNVCEGSNSASFEPSGMPMGSENTFTNICYTTSNEVAGLRPSTCKS